MKVYGDAVCAVPVTIGKTNVYVRTNIVKTETEEDKRRGAYMWDEVIYTKDEYIKLIDEQNKSLDAQLTGTQIALCDTYEQNIELENQLTDTQLALCDVYELIVIE